MATRTRPFSRAIGLFFFCATWGSQTFAQELPEPAPHTTVSSALGNGTSDATSAIQAAIDGTYSAWEQIYLPPGRYVVSDTITLSRFLTLRGAGPDKTTIVLAAQSPGFSDPENPKPILRTGDGGIGNHNNTTHSAHIFNLTIEVAAGNPGAVGIDVLVHNGGGVENVVLRALEGSGAVGLGMTRDSPGPGLINQVTIEGFAVGVRAGYGVYGMTLEDLFLTGQTQAGIENNQHPLTLRRVFSNNAVPAIISSAPSYGLLVLLDSVLEGGSQDSVAIENDGPAYLRNVSSDGYAALVGGEGAGVPEAEIAEWWSQPPVFRQGSPSRALNLPVANMPRASWEEPSKWVSVSAFEDQRQGDNWGPAIQAAIDSGATTIYFPSATHAPYPVEGDVIVRGAVRTVVGMYANIGEGRWVFDVADPNATVYMEQVRTDGGYVQRGAGRVVLRRSMGGSVTTEKGSGDLFVDDWCCGFFDVNESKVFVRQLNEESEGLKLTNRGGKLWVLGLKTEQFGQVGLFENGAQTEILGSLLYPVQGSPSTPVYQNDSSSFVAFHRTMGNGYPTFTREIDQGAQEDVNPSFDGVEFYVSNAMGLGDDAVVEKPTRDGSQTGTGGANAPSGGSLTGGGVLGGGAGGTSGEGLAGEGCSCRQAGRSTGVSYSGLAFTSLLGAWLIARRRNRSAAQ